MPTRPWLRRISVAGLVGRGRRRATLSAGLTLPVALAGMLAASGCRTDSTSARLSSLSPTQWLQRRDAADAIDLQPVPARAATAPPLPTSPVVADPFATGAEPEAPPAPSAPAPEPSGGADSDAFYDIRPTSAETNAPREPSWTNRFRSLFRREPSANAAKHPIRIASASRSNEAERPPVPRTTRVVRPSTVRLDLPQFEPETEQVPPEPAVQTVARSEPARPPVRRPEPLPVIAPGNRSAQKTTDAGPQAWPYAIAEQPRFSPAPMPSVQEPASTAPPALLRMSEESSGPALLR